jgi:AP-2 complex subunit sigma-1
MLQQIYYYFFNNRLCLKRKIFIKQYIFKSNMIHFVLVINRSGKSRCTKFYVPCADEAERDRQKIEVHRLVTSRESNFCNFVEYRSQKIVYRRYAGLFFCFCIDLTDNEMAILELIHLFVETLDTFFENVRELDLVFNFHKTFMILDELIVAGEINEVAKSVIVSRIHAIENLE